MIGVGLTGLASGLDTEALISALLDVERLPKTRLQMREDGVEAKQNALRDVSTRLKNLKTAAADLRGLGVWADTQTVESSDATKVSARRLSGAGPGGYQVSVSQLARAEQRTYNFTQDPAASSITIDGVQVDLAANATLDDAVAAINSKAESPVYAVKVNGQLVLSSKETGAANGFAAAGSTVAEDAPKAKLGLDAQFTIDGGSAQTSASNVVTSAIPGIELTLKATTASPLTVTVGAPGPDKAAVKDKVKKFVEQYNSTVEFIRGKLAEERDPKATTATAVAKGQLRNDTMLDGVLRELRQSLGEVFAGNPADLDQLSDLGISTGTTTGGGSTSKDAIAGKLVLDEAKLDEKLNANPLGVRRLLGAVSGVDGFAQRLEGIIDPATTGGGTLDGRISAADGELKRIRDAMGVVDRRLEEKEKRLRAQFADLERLLSQSQQQSQWAGGQLVALSSQGR